VVGGHPTVRYCVDKLRTIITPTKSRSSASRRVRQNKSPRMVVSYTPQQSFEANLARHNDATPIRGKFIGSVTLATSGVPVAAFLIQPSNLGARVASISTDYLRYRIKWLRLRFLGAPTTAGTNVGLTALGILDDVNYSGEPPTTLSGVAELRCSATSFQNESIPTIFEFMPVDKKRWYYCTSPTNDRFDSVGTLYAASMSIGSVQYEMDYCVVFSGAFTTGAV